MVANFQMKSILQEAEEIVNGERQQAYGDPVKSFKDIAEIFNLISGDLIEAKDVILILIVVKLVRESYQHKRDNLVDICGYAELLNRLEE